MKKIFFLRHAKSSWSDFSLKDFDRPLSTRGIQDAELMGNYFKAKKNLGPLCHNFKPVKKN
ncbi:MAG: hypothetical protein Ct9H90mP19_4770 [Gammaproteobacteria bacterium]|nr:MAG: hypothetical protein Ct9H90mP19_4770 [Gammaproteobacteria bacterium]